MTINHPFDKSINLINLFRSDKWHQLAQFIWLRH
jgi:hypothetical protein